MFDYRSFVRSKRRFELIRGNALHVLREMPSRSIDGFVSDPPYGIELCLQWTGKKKVVIGDGKLEARELWKSFIPEAYRIARDNTAHVFFAAWNAPWVQDLLAQHFTVKGGIVWYKRQWGLGYYLRPRWELAFYCHKGRPPLPAKADCNVWEHSRDGRLLHPCQKPVDLLRRAVRLVAPPRSIICDPFAGIGSTGVATVMEKCRFVGVEIDPRYVKLGRKRIENALKEC